MGETNALRFIVEGSFSFRDVILIVTFASCDRCTFTNKGIWLPEVLDSNVKNLIIKSKDRKSLTIKPRTLAPNTMHMLFLPMEDSMIHQTFKLDIVNERNYHSIRQQFTAWGGQVKRSEMNFFNIIKNPVNHKCWAKITGPGKWITPRDSTSDRFTSLSAHEVQVPWIVNDSQTDLNEGQIAIEQICAHKNAENKLSDFYTFFTATYIIADQIHPISLGSMSAGGYTVFDVQLIDFTYSERCSAEIRHDEAVWLDKHPEYELAKYGKEISLLPFDTPLDKVLNVFTLGPNDKQIIWRRKAGLIKRYGWTSANKIGGNWRPGKQSYTVETRAERERPKRFRWVFKHGRAQGGQEGQQEGEGGNKIQIVTTCRSTVDGQTYDSTRTYEGTLNQFNPSVKAMGWSRESVVLFVSSNEITHFQLISSKDKKQIILPSFWGSFEKGGTYTDRRLSASQQGPRAPQLDVLQHGPRQLEGVEDSSATLYDIWGDFHATVELFGAKERPIFITKPAALEGHPIGPAYWIRLPLDPSDPSPTVLAGSPGHSFWLFDKPQPQGQSIFKVMLASSEDAPSEFGSIFHDINNRAVLPSGTLESLWRDTLAQTEKVTAETETSNLYLCLFRPNVGMKKLTLWNPAGFSDNFMDNIVKVEGGTAKAADELRGGVKEIVITPNSQPPHIFKIWIASAATVNPDAILEELEDQTFKVRIPFA